MSRIRRFVFAGAVVAIHGAAIAQGRPEAGEHRQHGEAPPAASPVASAAAPGRAQGREWTRYPILAPTMARGAERMAAVLRPVGIDAVEIQVFAAAGPADKRRQTVPVGPEGARIEPAGPKLGNYHWVVARSEAAGEVRVASTVWYFSNPGAAPTALLKEAKHELEVVPDPLPREHSAYRESEKWNFIVRFNGVPVPNQLVTMETEFGSRSSFQTNAEGRALVLFPRDFKPATPAQAAPGGHEMGPRRARFVLAAEREEGGIRYLTAFNTTYSPDADRNRSLAWGAAFGLLGMVAATPLLRRRPAKSGTGESNV